MIIIGTLSILLLIIAIIFIILIVIFITGKYESIEIARSSYALGTLINLKAYGNKTEKAIDEAFERLNNIDDKIYKEADDLLYEAKKSGRNQIKVND